MEDEYNEEIDEELEEIQREKQEEMQEDQMDNQEEWREQYGVPEQEEKFNQHKFLAESIRLQDSEKVTFLLEQELGRPLFNVRFLLDLEDVAKHYLDSIAKELGVENRIAIYFRQKINNICSSGMSNKGFVQNLNASRIIEATRRRVNNLPQMKGGKK